MKLWLTLTGQRCPNTWRIYGENIFGVADSRRVRCDLPRGHAGPCENEGVFHFMSTRSFNG